MKRHSFCEAFEFAFNGLLHGFKTERNLRFHFSALIFVIILGITLNISLVEWIAVILVSLLVISLELINTSIEMIVNNLVKEYNADAKIVKDISAAAVLIAAIGAVVIGLIVFLPKLYLLLG